MSENIFPVGTQLERPTIELDSDKFFMIRLPTGFIEGVFYDDDQTVYVEQFDVYRDERKKGSGTRLLKALAATAKQRGIDKMSGNIISAEAVRLRAEVLGEDNMHVYEDEKSTDVELPISVEQAQLSIERSIKAFYEYKDEHGQWPDFGLGFYVVSDLSQLDTSGWEKPVEGI